MIEPQNVIVRNGTYDSLSLSFDFSPFISSFVNVRSRVGIRVDVRVLFIIHRRLILQDLIKENPK